MMMIMIVTVTVIVMMSMTDASDDDDDDDDDYYDNMSLDPVIPSFFGGGVRGFNKFLKQTAKTAK